MSVRRPNVAVAEVFSASWRVAKVRLRSFFSVACVAVGLGACADRSPQTVAVAQPQDRYMDGLAIAAEVEADNIPVEELASEEGSKGAQNVAVGMAGLVVWPPWLGMDFQGSASKEAAALSSGAWHATSTGFR